MIFLNALFLGLFGVFALKVIWNIVMAYAAVWDLIKHRRSESRGVSLMPAIECLALGVLSAVALVLGDQVPVFGERSVFLLGISAILASYVHLIVVGMIGGFIASIVANR